MFMAIFFNTKSCILILLLFFNFVTQYHKSKMYQN